MKRDPAHVSYVRNPTMDFPTAGTTADHAYWLSAIGVREGGGEAPLGTLDAVSGGIPEGDAPVGDTERGGGSLAGGNLGALAFTSQSRAWGDAPVQAAHRRARAEGPQRRHGHRAPRARADHLRRGADGRHRRPGAGRARGLRAAETFSGAGTFTRAGAACASTAGFRRAAVRPRGRRVRIAFSRALRRKVTVDVLRHSRGSRVIGARRVKRFARPRAVVHLERARGGRARGYFTVRLRMRLPGGGVDERRVVLERVRGGRFAKRPAAVRRSSCRVFTRFVLGSPVFGGTSLRKLSVRYALARSARTRVELIRGRRVIRTLAKTRTVRAGRLRTLALRPRTVPRGKYRVRLVIRRRGRPRAVGHAGRAPPLT